MNPEDTGTECSEFVFQFSRGRISPLQVEDEWIYAVGKISWNNQLLKLLDLACINKGYVNHKALNASIYTIIIFPECCKKYKATIDKC